jgi:hypothetical protein
MAYGSSTTEEISENVSILVPRMYIAVVFCTIKYTSAPVQLPEAGVLKKLSLAGLAKLSQLRYS